MEPVVLKEKSPTTQRQRQRQSQYPRDASEMELVAKFEECTVSERKPSSWVAHNTPWTYPLWGDLKH